MKLLAATASLAILPTLGRAQGDLPRVHISSEQTQVSMGRTLAVTAAVTAPSGESPAGRLLLPYVNGVRWGAHTYADDEGRATILLPLPNPGTATVQVAVDPVVRRPAEQWIWSRTVADKQRVWLQGVFDAPAPVTSASLWMAADDTADLFINGEKIASRAGWTNVPSLDVASHLHTGQNVFSVEGYNGSGPAGVLIRMEWRAGARSGVYVTSTNWRAYASKPAGWPGLDPAPGVEIASFGRSDQSLWSPMMTGWPTVPQWSRLLTGDPMPAGSLVSNPLRIEVGRRRIERRYDDPDHLVGMQWEPWFSELNANWHTAEAVPLMGFYRSNNPNVLRQELLWFADSGIDFLIADWTNQLWNKQHWTERSKAADQIVNGTTAALDTLAAMRDEGIPVPKMVILTGLYNGASTTTQALNEEQDWIYQTYVRNPRYHDLFVDYLGKPLIMPFNQGGPRWLQQAGGPAVDASHFTIRWCSSQNQDSHNNDAGYWSWMDGVLQQPITDFDGKPEAITACCGLFTGNGWLAPGAYGRRNGWTLVESFRGAVEHHPRFVMFHQWAEFTGQLEGRGSGPEHNGYADSYSAELSDDIEPTSLTTPAYRGDGGWGFEELNLIRALVDLLHQKRQETTVVAIEQPLRAATVTASKLDVRWTSLGKSASDFTIFVDGRVAAENVHTTHASIDLGDHAAGPVTIRVVAQGTAMRYPPAWTEDSLPLDHTEAAYADVSFTLQRSR